MGPARRAGLAIACAFAPGALAWAGAWPQVAPATQVLQPATVPAEFVLRDAGGQPLYHLACVAGADAPARCTLRAEGEATDLLQPAARGARARGLFRARDVQGACASYPEFGRQRSFRLRGLELTLLLDEGGVVRASVRPDAQASAAVAEAPATADPDTTGRGCAVQPAAEDPFSCRKPVVEVVKPTCGP